MSTLFRILRRKPRCRWVDLPLIVLPALAWLGAVHARPAIMELACLHSATACQKDSVSAFDRVAIRPYLETADIASFWTQNSSGILAAIIPMVWNGSLWAAGRLTPGLAALSLFTDLVLLTETSVWNGLTTESTRLLVQRPRPYVYDDRAQYGQEAAYYTSFYSGHTSFAAASTASLLFAAIGRGLPGPVLLALSGVGALLVATTGYLRVISGRHFPTDVIAGAFAGLLIALLVALLHRGAVTAASQRPRTPHS